ncbi:hypothetical protein Pst134EA_019753 [Puccinia striiformis f. sp. tritici]|uniref:hypothetical protein n=1 Tax=Puccinia striiformis f. sp. tritici TaxID=168172 RepID=UPI0020084E36|nr:hypothetical protein Pst134EA_019753 [Puccinia striiformis f. sp. tritici]KAH9459613.1 hypothetical protein Pst134EA_019753 [Puccinia striiformis f. sp. tritici]
MDEPPVHKEEPPTEHHPFRLPTVLLDPPSQDKSNYRSKYDPALDSSLVKKSAGPLYRHSKPVLTIKSNPNRDPRLKLAYPAPLSTHPTTSSGRSALIAGLSRSSRTKQAFHSKVELLTSYPYDRNSLGPPPPAPPSAILITMLDKLVTGEQVRSHFSQFGRIAECEIKLDPQTGGSLGICWLRFLNQITHPTADSRHSSSQPSTSNSHSSKNNRNQQDGHQSALAAVKKANGARIGCMLTMGPPAPTSSSAARRSSSTKIHYGIRCQLDGEGKKCEQAVAEQLDLLYPPLPPSLHSKISALHPCPRRHSYQIPPRQRSSANRTYSRLQINHPSDPDHLTRQFQPLILLPLNILFLNLKFRTDNQIPSPLPPPYIRTPILLSHHHHHPVYLINPQDQIAMSSVIITSPSHLPNITFALNDYHPRLHRHRHIPLLQLLQPICRPCPPPCASETIIRPLLT